MTLHFYLILPNKLDTILSKKPFNTKKELNWFFSWMNRSIPDPFQFSRKGSRSVQDPKKVECNPDLELMRSVPDHVWVAVAIMSYFSTFLFICITLWNSRENFWRDPPPGPPLFWKIRPPPAEKKLDPLPWAFGAHAHMIKNSNTVHIGFCDYWLSGQSGFSDRKPLDGPPSVHK